MKELTTEVVQKDSALTSMLVSRQAQEVQAAMVIAKKFPRDEFEAHKRIMKSCARIGLAEQAEYTYPRGGEKIVGASIRLAESIAQNWGNIDCGIIELENKNGQSEMMAYAWDLETNTRITKVFSVKHKRDTRGGSYALTDSRDIYEATANFGSRRVRACILAIIPGDVIEDAIKQCRKTIAGDNKSPIEDRIKVMLQKFETDHRVTTAEIEEYLGCNAKSFTDKDLIKMRGVYQSIVDGMSTPKDYFGRPEAAKPEIKSPFPAGQGNSATTTTATLAPAVVAAAPKEDKPKDPPPPLKPAFDEVKHKEELKAKHPHYDDSYIDHLVKEAKAKW